MIISGTIVDASGRTLSGQTVEAFWHSVRHARAADRRAQLRARPTPAPRAPRRAVADRRSPGLRLPERRPARTSSAATTRRPRRWPRPSASGPGTACSTSPAAAAARRPTHIAAIAEAVAGLPPRRSPAVAASTRLSGLEPLVIPPPGNAFVNVGERTNVTGSRKFARLIAEGGEDEAVDDRPGAGRQRRPADRRQHGRGDARRRRRR